MSPLSEPPARLDGFPRRRLPPTAPLYRIHRLDRAPWWFSHDGSGRFDLATPRGTCYLAEEPLGAFVEVFRAMAVVPSAEVDARRVSTLHAPRPFVLADCTSRRARAFGITAAIHSGEDYTRTQAWAAALAAAGFDGVRYLLSHDPAQRSVGVALFGPAGLAQWPVEATGPVDSTVILRARREFGIRVVPTPR